MTKPIPDDTDILAWKGCHPIAGNAWYERVKQDRRIYYRFRFATQGGGLTDAKHARMTIAYYTEKGWTL